MGSNVTNDCYQVKLQVKLSEEDSCLYERFGLGIFNISKASESTCEEVCKSVNTGGVYSKCEVKQEVCKKLDKVEDAIVGLDIDKCDCTKGTFHLYVCLPRTTNGCKNGSTSAATNDSTYEVRFPDGSTCNYDVPAQSPTVGDLKRSIDNDVEGVCADDLFIMDQDNMCCALDDSESLNHQFKYHVQLPYRCEPQKYVITIGSSTVAKEVVTFDVQPLQLGVNTSGVVTECYSYEIVRTNKCCSPLEKRDRCFRLIVPLTKDIKCLVPDFGISGILLNSTLETTVRTKVRIQSISPNCVSWPACLTINKEDCTACLEVKDMSPDQYCEAIRGYEYLYGADGCYCQKNNDKCSTFTEPGDWNWDRLPGAWNWDRLPRDGILNLVDKMESLMEVLSTLRRWRVTGVDKCKETTLLTFQVCRVSLRTPYAYVCGKLVDVCDNHGDTDPNTDYDTHGHRILADSSEYCYEVRGPVDADQDDCPPTTLCC